MKVIAAAVLSDRGELLPYTCQGSMQYCEEKASKTLAGWDRMKELGARVVQVWIVTEDEIWDKFTDGLSASEKRLVRYADAYEQVRLTEAKCRYCHKWWRSCNKSNHDDTKVLDRHMRRGGTAEKPIYCSGSSLPAKHERMPGWLKKALKKRERSLSSLTPGQSESLLDKKAAKPPVGGN